MPDPKRYTEFVRRLVAKRLLGAHPNMRGALLFAPGHFYSPLLDIQSFEAGGSHLSVDGEEQWENVDLRPTEQRSYYSFLLHEFPSLPFPREKSDGYRYFTRNDWFTLADAFTLSGIIRHQRPRRIVEVGSGFSSAVMIDTLRCAGLSAALTFVEPYPDRLDELLTDDDRSGTTTLVQPVQKVALSVFDQLDAQDMLFIDSSHVAKIGSDVTFLLLRVLPRLRRGVLVHFHDIFYPHSYPADWIREGRAWNESLFLRAFLVGNSQFEIVAFNSYAGYTMSELFRERFPAFLDDTGGSIWLRKIG